MERFRITEKLDVQVVNDFSITLNEIKSHFNQRTEESDLLFSKLEDLLAEWVNLDKDKQVNNYAFQKMLVILIEFLRICRNVICSIKSDVIFHLLQCLPIERA